ncbi:MAG: hypothetical protein NT118_14330 [Lentisphaerae bacterium]|nr:hypothetical protein [Lentisphaerota bacterium]
MHMNTRSPLAKRKMPTGEPKPAFNRYFDHNAHELIQTAANRANDRYPHFSNMEAGINVDGIFLAIKYARSATKGASSSMLKKTILSVVSGITSDNAVSVNSDMCDIGADEALLPTR